MTPFQSKLKTLFPKSTVVLNLDYQKIIIDYAVIVNDTMIEVKDVQSKDDYIRELQVLGRGGKTTYNKHKRIQEGKFIATAFYFMAPAGILKPIELPRGYGLIAYPAKYTEKAGPQLAIKQEADYFSKEPNQYLTRSNYRTLFEKMADQLYGS